MEVQTQKDCSGAEEDEEEVGSFVVEDDDGGWLPPPYAGLGGEASPGRGGKWVCFARSACRMSHSRRWALINVVKSAAYLRPVEERVLSPPIFPDRLSMDSPWRVIQIWRGARLKFRR